MSICQLILMTSNLFFRTPNSHPPCFLVINTESKLMSSKDFPPFLNLLDLMNNENKYRCCINSLR